jgi:hypothetical protein
MPVEQTEELVESLPMPGFAPLILGKGTDAAAEDIAGLSLGQPQFPPDSPDLHRRKGFIRTLSAAEVFDKYKP